MSEFFVKTFNKSTGCASCKHGKLRVGNRVYSLCEKHLDMAREKWRCWQEQRRTDGKCISCNRANHNGWLRCQTHTKLNREKCRRWVATHKEHQAMKAKARTMYFVDERGLCICAAHNPIAPGRRRCQPCLIRHQSYGKAEVRS